MISPLSVKEYIKAEAQHLGFDRIGFTSPDPAESFPIFQRWLAKNRHADMAYLARSDTVESRADPRRLFPPVKTIVCLSMPYPRPEDAPNTKSQPAGRVAAYAWAADYHQVIPYLLQGLVEHVQEFIAQPVGYKIFTDSAPILERDLARRAGLGWIGKNSCLIHPQYGSYFLLAELFLDIDIEPDAPFEVDHCGSCQRCIDACPTHCILPDRTLDAGRCISYLTIEHKAVIPPDLRPAAGDWVFGCDICQQVCPWNIRFARTNSSSPLTTRQKNHARPTLTLELSLSPQQFRDKFAGSPISRAKRRGYLRNIAVALGNSKTNQAIPALITCLKNEEDALIRAHAAWALGQLDNANARSALEQASHSETHPAVLDEIHRALKKTPTHQGNHCGNAPF